jgi:hypothetical protein
MWRRRVLMGRISGAVVVMVYSNSAGQRRGDADSQGFFGKKIKKLVAN